MCHFHLGLAILGLNCEFKNVEVNNYTQQRNKGIPKENVKLDK